MLGVGVGVVGVGRWFDLWTVHVNRQHDVMWSLRLNTIGGLSIPATTGRERTRVDLSAPNLGVLEISDAGRSTNIRQATGRGAQDYQEWTRVGGSIESRID